MQQFFQIDLDDNLPQLVCSNCVERLETAYLFKQECERSDLTLRKLLVENVIISVFINVRYIY